MQEFLFWISIGFFNNGCGAIGGAGGGTIKVCTFSVFFSLSATIGILDFDLPSLTLLNSYLRHNAGLFSTIVK